MPIDNALLDQIAGRIAEGMRALGGARGEVEAQVRAVVEGALQHFDVVTNERMQVQEAMLAKAREELVALEARVRALEELLKQR